MGGNEGHYLLIGFAIAIVAAVSVALTSSHEISRNDTSIDWIMHTGRVLGALDTARADSFESLVALQNYAHTGDPKSLDIVALSVKKVHGKTRGSAPSPRITRSSSNGSIAVEETAARAADLAQQVIRIAATTSRVEVVKAAGFLRVGRRAVPTSRRFNPMSATEQALLLARTTKARATSRQGAMVMGIGGSFIFLWLLLIGGYAGLTANRLKQTAVDRKNADDRFRALLRDRPRRDGAGG